MKVFSGLAKFWWGFIYFMLMMSFWRLVFLASQYDTLISGAGLLYLKAFFVGLRLDAAVASYLMLPVIIILLLALVKLKSKWIDGIISGYYYLATALISLFNVVDIYYFKQINEHPDYILVKTYTTQEDSMGFIMEEYPVLPALLFLTMIAILLFSFYDHISRKIKHQPASWGLKLGAVVLSALILGTAARGGWQERPVDWGHAMFSQNFIANQVALNNLFFFGRSIVQFKSEDKARELVMFYDEAEALATTRSLLDAPGTEFLDEASITRKRVDAKGTNNYNIFLFVLESHVGEFCGYISGTDSSITPNLDRIAKEGIAFTNCFATGKRSAYGLSSIIMSWPCLPGLPLISRVEGTKRAPSIATTLQSDGYETLFMYGGDAQFDNMKGFATANGFNRVLERKHFKRGQKGTKWGVFDHHVFDRALTEINATDKPLFLTLFTTTNHQPWSLPDEYLDQVAEADQDAFYDGHVHQGMCYVDIVLGNFMEKAAKHDWYETSIYIFIADHGLPVYRYQFSELKNARIPLIVYAPGLDLDARTIDNPISQTEVAPIIFDLIDYSEPYTFFGQSVLSDSSTFACRVVGDKAYWIEEDHLYVEIFEQGSRLYQITLPVTEQPKEIHSEELMDRYQRRFRSYLQTACSQMRAYGEAVQN